MITKLILATLLVTSVTYSSVDNTLYTKPSSLKNTTKYAAWTPSIAAKKSGESCDDGNCLTDLNCMTKDGMMYKLFSSVRDEKKE